MFREILKDYVATATEWTYADLKIIAKSNYFLLLKSSIQKTQFVVGYETLSIVLHSVSLGDVFSFRCGCSHLSSWDCILKVFIAESPLFWWIADFDHVLATVSGCRLKRKTLPLCLAKEINVLAHDVQPPCSLSSCTHHTTNPFEKTGALSLRCDCTFYVFDYPVADKRFMSNQRGSERCFVAVKANMGKYVKIWIGYFNWTRAAGELKSLYLALVVYFTRAYTPRS